MENINLIEIGPAVIKIWGVENDDLAVPVNNTCMPHVFLGRWHTTVCLDRSNFILLILFFPILDGNNSYIKRKIMLSWGQTQMTQLAITALDLDS